MELFLAQQWVCVMYIITCMMKLVNSDFLKEELQCKVTTILSF
jgi:hypothetical protein